jgi:hypothetical protein
MNSPHWKVDREKLLATFDVVQAFPNTTAKTASLRKEKDALKFTATNKDYYIETVLPLLNRDNQEPSLDPVFFNFSTLRYLASANKDFVLVYKDKQLYFVAEGFQVKVDTYALNAGMTEMSLPIKSPSTPLFSPFLLDTMSFLFSQTANVLENKVLVNGSKVSCVFTEFSGEIEALDSSSETKEGDLVAPAPQYGRMYLRRTDLPVLHALSKLSKGKALFSFNKNDKRFWANHESTWVSFLVLPEKDPSKSVEEKAMLGISESKEVHLDIGRTVLALNTLSFLKVQNVQFFSKENIIRAYSPQAQFIVGKGPMDDFTTAVDRLQSFFGFVPAPAIVGGTATFRKMKSSVVIGFEHKLTRVTFLVRNDMSQTKTVKKAPEVYRSATPPPAAGSGEGLASLLQS